jgi:hypothetical protein
MDKKLTAIEWLEDNLNFEPYDEEEFISNNKIWEQAKQMEKEQIKQAFNTDKSWFTLYIEQNEGLNLSEKYYNETYNGTNLPS